MTVDRMRPRRYPRRRDRAPAADKKIEPPPALVPWPADTDRLFARLAHQDLSALSARQLWAESIVLSQELAARCVFGIRARIAYMQVDLGPVNDERWLAERLRRVKGELKRRKPQRGTRRGR